MEVFQNRIIIQYLRIIDSSLELYTIVRLALIFQSSDPQEPNEKVDNVSLTSMYLCSELDPELDSQNMVQLQLAPSEVILVQVKKVKTVPFRDTQPLVISYALPLNRIPNQTYTHNNTITHIHTHPLTHSLTCTRAREHTHTHTHTHTRTHAHTHTHKAKKKKKQSSSLP